MKTACIIAAAGKGVRSKLEYNKVLHYFGAQNALQMCMEKFCFCDQLVIVCNHEDMPQIKLLAQPYNAKVVLGAQTRTGSIKNGICALDACDYVFVHDAARPFVSDKVIQDALNAALKTGGAVPCISPTDSLISAKNGLICHAIDRQSTYLVQTPQVFDYQKLCLAYQSIDQDFTDDSAVFLASGFECAISEGSVYNVKLTHPKDFFNQNLHIGCGFDVHQLVFERKLILGGVHIEHHKGLKGHSDADVLLHAVCDALLSSCGLCDIGHYFPDTDTKFKDADSQELLKNCMEIATQHGFAPYQLSCVIMAEKPKLAPYLPQMKANICKILQLDTQKCAIMATTCETLGIIGKEQGMAASCVLLAKKII